MDKDLCKSCGGTGHALENISPNPEMPVYESILCPACSGSQWNDIAARSRIKTDGLKAMNKVIEQYFGDK